MISQSHANLTTLPTDFFFCWPHETEVRADVGVGEERIDALAILSPSILWLLDRMIIMKALPENARFRMRNAAKQNRKTS
jgi:hypothetical protein